MKLIIFANITAIIIGLVAFDAGHKLGIKEGYTNGYQARIDYEHGKE